MNLPSTSPFAVENGEGCAPTPDSENDQTGADPLDPVSVNAGSFSFTQQYTPGNPVPYLVCAYLSYDPQGNVVTGAVTRFTAIVRPSSAFDLEFQGIQDPFARGAYSHALPGHADKRAVLAASVDGRLFFAGEATSPNFFSTAHGAYETGVAAAEQALAALGLRSSLRP